ncbi:ubiquitin carboxyl-terminal hydrolase faf-x-related [Anaeramoeba flamelloides]|uniref:Ubiquitin carboxyl-terminal hydrolase faf-x-related n=1 Tax=Anaeramoeba flamelloides TaxID=1746091 RepID=A0AAV7ZWZ4_9EUKA|nr:ubiquitin carboxyl-terminal hydrolase faf-x-related [Anaeramoeba flamelloides]
MNKRRNNDQSEIKVPFINFSPQQSDEKEKSDEKEEKETFIKKKYSYFQNKHNILGFVSYENSFLEEINSLPTFRRTIKTLKSQLSRISDPLFNQPLQTLNDYQKGAIKKSLGEIEHDLFLKQNLFLIFEIILRRKFKIDHSSEIQSFFHNSILLLLNDEVDTNPITFSKFLIYVLTPKNYQWDFVKRKLFKDSSLNTERSLYQHPFCFVMVNKKNGDDPNDQLSITEEYESVVHEQYSKTKSIDKEQHLHHRLYSVLDKNDQQTSLNFIKNLQTFGNMGGFTIILNQMGKNEGKKIPTLNEIHNYLLLIGTIEIFLSENFKKDFLPKFIDLIEQQLKFHWCNIEEKLNIKMFYINFQKCIPLLSNLYNAMNLLSGLNNLESKIYLKEQQLCLKFIEFAFNPNKNKIQLNLQIINKEMNVESKLGKGKQIENKKKNKILQLQNNNTKNEIINENKNEIEIEINDEMERENDTVKGKENEKGNKVKGNNKIKQKNSNNYQYLGLKLLNGIIENIEKRQMNSVKKSNSNLKKNATKKLQKQNRREYKELTNDLIEWFQKQETFKLLLTKDLENKIILKLTIKIFLFLTKHNQITIKNLDFLWDFCFQSNLERSTRNSLFEILISLIKVFDIKMIINIKKKIEKIELKNYDFSILKLLNNFTLSILNLLKIEENEFRHLNSNDHHHTQRHRNNKYLYHNNKQSNKNKNMNLINNTGNNKNNLNNLKMKINNKENENKIFEKETKIFTLNQLWNIIQEESKFSQSLSNKAQINLNELLSKKEFSQFRMKYIILCIEKLKKHKSIFLSIGILKNILIKGYGLTLNEKKNNHKKKNYPKTEKQILLNLKNLKRIQQKIQEINKKFDLIDLLIHDIKYYFERALEFCTIQYNLTMGINKNKSRRNTKGKGGQMGEMAGISEKKFQNIIDFTTKPFINEHTHFEEINARFNFLDFIIKYGNVYLNEEQLFTLWDYFVLKACSNLERKMLFKWLINCDVQDKNFLVNIQNGVNKNIILKYKIIESLFEKKICNGLNNNLVDLNYFQVFKRFFLLINVKKKALKPQIQNYKKTMKINGKVIRKTILRNTGKFFLMNKKIYLINTLWDIILRSSNIKVINNSIDFLNDIHINISSQLMDRKKYKIYLLFLNNILKKLINYNSLNKNNNCGVDDIGNVNRNNHEDQIIKLIKILRNFIKKYDNVHKKSSLMSLKLTPHKNRFCPVEKNIIIKLVKGKKKIIGNFKLVLHNRIKIKDLKLLICQISKIKNHENLIIKTPSGYLNNYLDDDPVQILNLKKNSIIYIKQLNITNDSNIDKINQKNNKNDIKKKKVGKKIEGGLKKRWGGEKRENGKRGTGAKGNKDKKILKQKEKNLKKLLKIKNKPKKDRFPAFYLSQLRNFNIFLNLLNGSRKIQIEIWKLIKLLPTNENLLINFSKISPNKKIPFNDHLLNTNSYPIIFEKNNKNNSLIFENNHHENRNNSNSSNNNNNNSNKNKNNQYNNNHFLFNIKNNKEFSIKELFPKKLNSIELYYCFQILEMMLNVNYENSIEYYEKFQTFKDYDWIKFYIQKNGIDYFINYFDKFNLLLIQLVKKENVMKIYNNNKEKYKYSKKKNDDHNLNNKNKNHFNEKYEFFFKSSALLMKIFKIIISDKSELIKKTRSNNKKNNNRNKIKSKKLNLGFETDEKYSDLDEQEKKKRLEKEFKFGLSDYFLKKLNSIKNLFEDFFEKILNIIQLLIILNENYFLNQILLNQISYLINNSFLILELLYKNKPNLWRNNWNYNFKKFIKICLFKNKNPLICKISTRFLTILIHYNNDEKKKNQLLNNIIKILISFLPNKIETINNSNNVINNKNKDYKNENKNMNNNNLNMNMNNMNMNMNNMNTNINTNKNQNKNNKNLKYFYSLLIKLLLLLSNNEFLHFFKLNSQFIDKLIMKLKNYNSTDSTKNMDQNLKGIISVIAVLFREDVPIDMIEYIEEKYQLIKEIFNGCLYCFVSKKKYPQRDQLLPKCKNLQTRNACYTLLLYFVQRSEKNLLILSKLIEKQMKYIRIPKVWGYVPIINQLDKNVGGYVGLRNQGATCYLNSVIQQLFMVPYFSNEIILSNIKRIDKQKTNMNKKDEKIKLTNDEIVLNQLKRLFQKLKQKKLRYYNTMPFCKVFKDIQGKPINVREQQDANEFLNVLFEKIEKGLKKDQIRQNLLNDIFGGCLIHQVICQEKKHISEREEPFFTISLEVKNKHYLRDSLELFIQGDKLTGENQYYCEQCRKKVDALKRCCFKDLPNYLILHLKRFEFDFQTMKNIKLNSYFEFPLNINMEKYTLDYLSNSNQKQNTNQSNHDNDDYNNDHDYNDHDYNDHDDDDVDVDDDDNDHDHDNIFKDKEEIKIGDYEYELVGVVVHSGSSEFGHYYSYIRENSQIHNGQKMRKENHNREKRVKNDDHNTNIGDEINYKWNKFNDTRVSSFNIKKLNDATFGNDLVNNSDSSSQQNGFKKKGYNAYMLFYKRKNIILTSSNNNNTFQTTTKTKNEENNENLKKEILNGKNKESELEIENEIEKEENEGGKPLSLVSRTNKLKIDDYKKLSLRLEQFLYNSDYSFFLSNLLEIQKRKHNLESKDNLKNKILLSHIKFATLFALKIVIHSKKKNHIMAWFKDLSSIFSKSYLASHKFLKILSSSKNSILLTKILLECPNVIIKDHFLDVITIAMNSIAKEDKNDYKECINGLITHQNKFNNKNKMEFGENNKIQRMGFKNNENKEKVENKENDDDDDYDDDELRYNNIEIEIESKIIQKPKSILIYFIKKIILRINKILLKKVNNFQHLFGILLKFAMIGLAEISYLTVSENILDVCSDFLINNYKGIKKLKKLSTKRRGSISRNSFYGNNPYYPSYKQRIIGKSKSKSKFSKQNDFKKQFNPLIELFQLIFMSIKQINRYDMNNNDNNKIEINSVVGKLLPFFKLVLLENIHPEKIYKIILRLSKNNLKISLDFTNIILEILLQNYIEFKQRNFILSLLNGLMELDDSLSIRRIHSLSQNIFEQFNTLKITNLQNLTKIWNNLDLLSKQLPQLELWIQDNSKLRNKITAKFFN